MKVGNFCANNLFDAFLHLQLAYCPLDYNTKSSAEDRELKYTREGEFLRNNARYFVKCRTQHTKCSTNRHGSIKAVHLFLKNGIIPLNFRYFWLGMIIEKRDELNTISSNELKHHFSNVKRTRMCSSIGDRT